MLELDTMGNVSQANELPPPFDSSTLGARFGVGFGAGSGVWIGIGFGAGSNAGFDADDGPVEVDWLESMMDEGGPATFAVDDVASRS